MGSTRKQVSAAFENLFRAPEARAAVPADPADASLAVLMLARYRETGTAQPFAQRPTPPGVYVDGRAAAVVQRPS